MTCCIFLRSRQLTRKILEGGVRTGRGVSTRNSKRKLLSSNTFGRSAVFVTVTLKNWFPLLIQRDSQLAIIAVIRNGTDGSCRRPKRLRIKFKVGDDGQQCSWLCMKDQRCCCYFFGLPGVCLIVSFYCFRQMRSLDESLEDIRDYSIMYQ